MAVFFVSSQIWRQSVWQISLNRIRISWLDFGGDLDGGLHFFGTFVVEIGDRWKDAAGKQTATSDQRLISKDWWQWKYVYVSKRSVPHVTSHTEDHQSSTAWDVMFKALVLGARAWNRRLHSKSSESWSHTQRCAVLRTEQLFDTWTCKTNMFDPSSSA